MDAHLHTWLSLLLRWAHVIAGVAWIGATFYFTWMENRLRRLGRAGAGWDIHGGGFNYLGATDTAPAELTARFDWFKRSAYTSWLTGVLLLIVIYYWHAANFMVDTGVADISVQLAVILGLATLWLSWLYYDLLCRSVPTRNELLLGVFVFAWFGLVTWVLTRLLSGHAAYLHVGAAAGTIMTANMYRVIAPAHKALLKAAGEGQGLDAGRLEMAMQRSRHNSYFALPVLFVMISGHYPVTYGHELNWLVLLLIALAGLAVRYYLDLTHGKGGKARVWVPALVLLAAAVFVTVPQPQPQQTVEEYGPPWLENVRGIVQHRCQQCHSTMPQFTDIAEAPRGIELDSQEEVLKYAHMMYEMTVISKTMPPDNSTQMTEEERQTIAEWYALVLHYNELRESAKSQAQPSQ